MTIRYWIVHIGLCLLELDRAYFTCIGPVAPCVLDSDRAYWIVPIGLGSCLLDFPDLELKKVSWLLEFYVCFLGVFSLGFLVSLSCFIWCLGFLVSLLRSSNVSKLQTFTNSISCLLRERERLIPYYWNFISCFRGDIHPIFKVFKNSTEGLSLFFVFGAHLSKTNKVDDSHYLRLPNIFVGNALVFLSN